MKISEEAQRILANVAQHYDVWLDASRHLATGRLQWKTVSGRDYLYRLIDRTGNGTSLGPRGADTEQLFAEFSRARETRVSTEEVLREEAGIYRALRLPRLPSFVGEVLRELDVRRLLGTSYVVVGTNALVAYALEGLQLFPPGMDTTDDFDLTWTEPVFASTPQPANALLAALKAVDATYTINTERDFQVRNSRGQEVELLLAESIAEKWGPSQKLRPVPLPEQDWLLKGRPVAHVIFDLGGKAARVVAPDPRWFGLHKLWLSQKPQRDRLKIAKDERQGMAVLDLVVAHMPHYRVDVAFREELPDALKPHLARWEARQSSGY